MKKAIIFIIIFIIVSYTIYLNILSKCMFSVKLNWNINIALEDKELYNYVDENIKINFNGDGYRYNILKYQNNFKLRKLNKFKWSNLEIDDTKKIEDILTKKIKINNKYMIDFSKHYYVYYKEKDENNYIYLLYSKKDKIIYVIQLFT